jgi:hypothetical protein
LRRLRTLPLGIGLGFGKRTHFGRGRGRWLDRTPEAAHRTPDQEGREADGVQLLAKRHRIELVDETLKHGRLPGVLLILNKG